MDKKSKNIVKEVIEDLYKFRQRELKKSETWINGSFQYKNSKSTEEERKDLIEQTIEEYDIPLIKLNNLLSVEDKIKEVIDLEQQMKKIQTKKYISIKEFQEIYGKSKTSQQGLRGRLKDPILYRQTVKNSAITYVVEEVERWFLNQHK